jgi:hypothetical protein
LSTPSQQSSVYKDLSEKAGLPLFAAPILGNSLLLGFRGVPAENCAADPRVFDAILEEW